MDKEKVDEEVLGAADVRGAVQGSWAERMVSRPYKERSRDFAEFALHWLTTKAVCEQFGSVATMHKQIHQGKFTDDPVLMAIKQLYEQDCVHWVRGLEQTFLDACAALGEDRAAAVLDALERRVCTLDDLGAEERAVVAGPWRTAAEQFRARWANMPGGESYDA